MSNARGYLMIAATFILVIMSTLLASLVHFTTRSNASAVLFIKANQAFDLSLAGLEEGQNAARLGQCNPAFSAPISLQDGQYRYKCETLVASSTLANRLNTNTPTLTLTNAQGFAESGAVIINNEIIFYDQKIGNELTGLSRAQRGTTSSNYNSGTPVSQQLQQITSEGAAPHFDAPEGKRTLARTLWSIEGFAVHQNGYIYRLDAEQWSLFSAVNDSLYALTCISNQCYVAGTNGQFFNFDGANFVAQNSVGNQTITSIDCSDPNSCHAVGTHETFYRFDPITNLWALQQDLGSNNVNSVSCISPSFCMAVGNSSRFYRFNGTWSQTQDLGNNNINALFCSASNQCVAAGASGKFYVFNGSSFVERQDLGNQTLYAITCPEPLFCLATGNGGRFFRFINNTSAEAIGTIGNSDVLTLTCRNSTQCMAAGAGGRFYQWNGSNWSLSTSQAANGNLRAMSLVDNEMILPLRYQF